MLCRTSTTLLTTALILGITVRHCNAAFLVAKPKSQRSITVSDKGPPDKPASWNAVANTSVTNHSLEAPAAIRNNMPLLHAVNRSTFGNGVVHFLFLINDNLHHQEIWKKFFSDAPQGSWKVFIHCKDPHGCARNRVFENNPGFVQVSTTPTWYCHDLVTAMAHLTSTALQAGAASYGGREKFVFLSESTLPTKPFSEIHGTLLLDDASDFCLFPADQWGTASIDGSFVKLIKHHQWVVLSRQHAELFAKDWISVNEQSQWRIWLKTGKWQGHDTYVYPQNFYYPPSANTCTDEWAFMATIFGALEPMGGARQLDHYGGGHIDMNTHTTQGRCRTWTYWDNSWDPAATALASQIANDFYGSSMSCFPKCHARPATLEKVSSSSLHALRRSPFLFARKFNPNIWMPNFAAIVLT
jgi:hypothetical protein